MSILYLVSVNAFSESLYIFQASTEKVPYNQKEVPSIPITQFVGSVAKKYTLKGSYQDRKTFYLDESTTRVMIEPENDLFRYIHVSRYDINLQSVGTYIRPIDKHKFNIYLMKVDPPIGVGHLYNICIYMTVGQKQNLWMFYYLDVINRMYKYTYVFDTHDEATFVDIDNISPLNPRALIADCEHNWQPK